MEKAVESLVEKGVLRRVDYYTKYVYKLHKEEDSEENQGCCAIPEACTLNVTCERALEVENKR